MVWALNHSGKRFKKDADFVWESSVKILPGFTKYADSCGDVVHASFFFFKYMDERRLDSLE